MPSALPPPPASRSLTRTTSAGFTLIELSIVLVIIGLIVGGILVGQDLINGAAIRAQITQIDRYNSAVHTFQTKYGGLPGDLNVTLASQFGFLVPTSCTGQQGGRDGNGLIDGGSGTTNVNGSGTLAALMGENALFWEDLSMANLIDANSTSNWSFGNSSSICGFSVTTTNPGLYIPQGKLGYSTYLHVYENAGYNWYQLADIPSFSSGTSSAPSVPTIPNIYAYNLDKKMDDGVPTSGTVQAVYINNSQCCTAQAPNAVNDGPGTCYNTAGPTYSIAGSNGSKTNCALSFRFQ